MVSDYRLVFLVVTLVPGGFAAWWGGGGGRGVLRYENDGVLFENFRT